MSGPLNTATSASHLVNMCCSLHTRCRAHSTLPRQRPTWLTCVAAFTQDVVVTQLHQVQSDVANDVSSAKDVELDSDLLQEVCNNCHRRYYTACVSTASAGEPACYRKYVTTVTGVTTQHVSAPRQPANRPVTGSM